MSTCFLYFCFPNTLAKNPFLLGDFVVAFFFVLAHEVFVGEFPGDHFVDGSPVGQSSEVAVVDEEVCLELARVVSVGSVFLFGVVAVDGIELDASLTAEGECFVEQPSFAYGPKDETMFVLLQPAQGFEGKGYFPANLRVSVFD